ACKRSAGHNGEQYPWPAHAPQHEFGCGTGFAAQNVNEVGRAEPEFAKHQRRSSQRQDQRRHRRPNEHAATSVTQGDVFAHVEHLNGHFITAPRRTAARRNGAPINAVTIPTISSCGRMITRARMSAATDASAPPTTAAGVRPRKPSPTVA